MKERRILVITSVLVLALIAAPGCVTNKKFDANVEDSDSRMNSIENAVEANDKKIAKLEKETTQRIGAVDQKATQANSVGSQAMTKAENAERAAQGKLLWTVTITDDKVKFPFGQAELTSEGISLLDGLVKKMKGYGKALYIEVEGHTDNVGSESLNTKLGWKRANAVTHYLNQSGGIPLHAMNTISFGEDKPIADNSSKDGRAQNRRVVIRVLE
jgi:outer membrane protein OmpA-like peptidoglycan-associated protein